MIFRSYLSLLEGMWDMTPFGYHVSTDSIWQRNTRKSNSGFIFQTHFCLFFWLICNCWNNSNWLAWLRQTWLCFDGQFGPVWKTNRVPSKLMINESMSIIMFAMICYDTKPFWGCVPHFRTHPNVICLVIYQIISPCSPIKCSISPFKSLSTHFP
jgi:hypothetical protein